PSDVICPGKCFQPPCAQRERCTPSERNGNEEEKERSEGDNCSQWSHYGNLFSSFSWLINVEVISSRRSQMCLHHSYDLQF
ncbi:hypothetical protein KIN20_011348, partial [Parelaphostrongylus tenuis]